jgi:regulator of protease activity HflC (stomatin/prohibitin superfamily)
MVVFVNAGQAAIKFSRFGGGTRVDRVYGEGIHLILPFDSMTIYDVRVQEQEHKVELLTTNGLTLKFQLSIRYQPEYSLLGILHKSVGPEYVKKIVIPEVISALRIQAGHFSAEDVFNTKRAFLDLVADHAVNNAGQRFVRIDRVIIQTIQLPRAIEQAVEEKIAQQHLAESYEYRIQQACSEARRKAIEAGAEQYFNDTIAASLTDNILRFKGIEATRALATSQNSKIVVIGNGDKGLPIIIGTDK